MDGSSQSHEGTDGLLSKNSLLNHRKCLPQVLNQTKTTLYTKSVDPDSEHGDGHAKVLLYMVFLSNLDIDFYMLLRA